MVEKLIGLALRNRLVVLLIAGGLFAYGIYSIKKKPLKKVLIGLSVSFVCFVVGVSLPGNTNDGVFFNPSDSERKQSVELSQADKNEKAAKSLLDQAATSFKSGRYKPAIDCCNQIPGDYSETETSSGIPQFLEDRYGKYSNLSAEDVCGQYNANEKYCTMLSTEVCAVCIMVHYAIIWYDISR